MKHICLSGGSILYGAKFITVQQKWSHTATFDTKVFSRYIRKFASQSDAIRLIPSIRSISILVC